MVQQAKLALCWKTMCFRQVKGLQNTQPLSYETKGFLSPDTLIACQAYPGKIRQEYVRRIHLHTPYDTKHTEYGTFLCEDEKYFVELLPNYFPYKKTEISHRSDFNMKAI